jgi:hypothetical protein
MWKTSTVQDLWEPVQKSYSVFDLYLRIAGKASLADIFMIDNHGKIKGETGKRQFLFFILKKVKDVDLEDISFLSRVTGYDEYWITDIVENLKDVLSPQFHRFARFRARRNKAFWRLKFLEKKMKNESNKWEKNRLKEKIERTRETMYTAMDVISRIRLSPTHKQIAAALQVPKGTVDSLFLRLRKKLKRVYQQKEKQYA